MSGRRHVGQAQRQWLKERESALTDAVPQNMVEGMEHMLHVAISTGLSRDDAYGAVAEALRAKQAKHRPHAKEWLVLEAGCLWLKRQQLNGKKP